MHCVKCGRQYELSYLFCNNCGVQLPIRSPTLKANSGSAGREGITNVLPERKVIEMQFPITIADAERVLILATLKATDNNKTHAAEVLGISLKTLHNKINEYGLRRA